MQKTEIVSSAFVEKLYSLAYNGELDATSTVSGSIEAPAAYEDSVKYLAGYIGATENPSGRFPNLKITIPNNNYYVRFNDDEFRKALIACCNTDYN